MSLERVGLFDTRSFLVFLFGIFCIALLSLSFEYYKFSELKSFDDAEIEAVVISQYLKTKNSKTYTILKLKAFGKNIYIRASKDIKNLRGRTLKLRIWTKNIDFLEYLKGFYIHSVILHVRAELALKERLNRAISLQHKDVVLKELYGALFSASPMSSELRKKLSALGVTHLFAISGFHLGVLAFMLIVMFSLPYHFFQERYFPYRNRKRDIFIFSIFVMLAYLLFLGWVPSLIRAFVMLVIGFILYDRHIKVISMQSLLVSILILLALWPTLVFSLGFYLSVSGVFYIFVFLKYFSSLNRVLMLTGVSIWVYLMMLPISLYIFHTFSILHPISIVWSIAFLPIYIISLLLHLIDQGAIFDTYLLYLLEFVEAKNVTVSGLFLALHVSISFLAAFFKRAFFLSFIIGIFTVVFAIYQVT
jgi:competence protein ComEC